MTKIISKSVSISTLDEGVTYEIQTSVDNVTIPSNQSQTVLSSAVARFYKKEGDNEKVAYNSQYSVYLRSGNTYTFLRSGTGTMCQMTATVASSHDAIVVYLFNNAYTSTSPESNQYVAKKEIKVVKNGNDGKNAVRIDISNENDMIACDTEEYVRFNRTIQTTAIIYDGSTPVQSVTSVGNVTLNVYRNGSVVNIAEKGTYSSNGVTFSFAFKKGDVLSSISYPINISIVYNGVTYTTTFTISRTDATAIYQLYPSLNEIAFGVNANNEFVPAEGIEITCGYTKHTGDGAKSYSGEDYSNTATSANDGNPETWMHYNAPYNIFFRWDNSGSWAWLRNQSNAGNYARILVPANTVHTSIEFALSSSVTMKYISDENILDRETIPIIKSGKKGEDGQDGEDGENVVRVDLDNEMDSMLYDGAGNKLSGNIVSHARLYDGLIEKTSDAIWALTASGCTISSQTGSTITVTGVSITDATVTATATYNGKTYSAVMSIKKIVNQDKYDLDVTPNALTLNTTTGWNGSKTITIKVMRTPAGGGTPTAINPSESQYGLAVSKTVGTLSQFDSTNKQFTLTITQQQATNNDNTVITLHKDGDSSKVYDRETVPFNKSANGADGVGERGKTGRFYYYAGEFDANNNTDTFSVSDIQVPFFSHGTNAVSGLPNCHLFDYDTNGSYTMYRMWQISGGGNWNAGDWNNDPWKVMWNDQKYLITEALFTNYAQFGSFIINADWMISMQGTRNGSTSNEYTYFDPLLGANTEVSLYGDFNVPYNIANLNTFALKNGVTYTFTVKVSTSATKSEYKLYNSSNTLQRTIIFTQGTSTLTQTFTLTPSSNGDYYFTAEKWSSSTTMYATIKVSCSSAFIPNFAVDGKTGRTYQNNAVVRGDVQAMTVISSNDQMETVIEAGSVEIRSKSTMSYGVFRINSNGEVVLSMYDKDGKKVIDLGGTPETQINGEWIVWVLRARDRGHNTDGKTYYATTESQCTTYYQLQLGQVINSGNTLEYFLPPIDGATEGVQTTDSNVISRNSNVFTSRATGASKTALETAIKNLTYITDGYYVKPNDGRFEVEANQYGPTNYKTDMYHFYTENGVHKMEIVTERFSL